MVISISTYASVWGVDLAHNTICYIKLGLHSLAKHLAVIQIVLQKYSSIFNTGTAVLISLSDRNVDIHTPHYFACVTEINAFC